MKAELNLNDSRGRALARLILALRDIREAKSFAHLVVTRIHLPNDGFFRPLSYASTIAYSRPFTGSRGYPELPLATVRSTDWTTMNSTSRSFQCVTNALRILTRN